MTYKKADFYSSPTMRQFSKIASDKGWLKSEKPIEKKASVASEPKGFVENAISLTAELRKQNNVVLNKLAEEIEYNLMQYKVASVYGVFNETGEDLVDQAHPDGSHKMEGMMGDAVIETVVDQQKKIHEVVFKKPKGKLANRELIELVKNAISWFHTEPMKDAYNIISDKINEDLLVKLTELKDQIKTWTSNTGNFRPADVDAGMPALINKNISDIVNAVSGIASGSQFSRMKDLKVNLENLKSFMEGPLKGKLSDSFKWKLPGWTRQIEGLIDGFVEGVVNPLIEKSELQSSSDKAKGIDKRLGGSLEDRKKAYENCLTYLSSFPMYKDKMQKVLDSDNEGLKSWVNSTYSKFYEKTYADWVSLSKMLLSSMKSESVKPPVVSGKVLDNGKAVDDLFDSVQLKLSEVFSKTASYNDKLVSLGILTLLTGPAVAAWYAWVKTDPFVDQIPDNVKKLETEFASSGSTIYHKQINTFRPTLAALTALHDKFVLNPAINSKGYLKFIKDIANPKIDDLKKSVKREYDKTHSMPSKIIDSIKPWQQTADTIIGAANSLQMALNKVYGEIQNTLAEHAEEIKEKEKHQANINMIKTDLKWASSELDWANKYDKSKLSIENKNVIEEQISNLNELIFDLNIILKSLETDDSGIETPSLLDSTKEFKNTEDYASFIKIYKDEYQKFEQYWHKNNL